MDNPLNTNYGLINIDLGPLCGVANNLIDKLASAVGWIANRDTPDRLAVKNYISEIQKSNLPPLIKAVKISNAKKEIKEYINQNEIVKIAVENINDNAHPENIDDDWIFQFMDKAKLISDAQFQLIWGHILKEECNSPNSMPKSLLYILTMMDKKDAEYFTALCSFSVYIDDNGIKEFTPVVISSQIDNYYSKNGITYDALFNLESLGLIQINIGLTDNFYTTKSGTRPIIIHYFDDTFQFPNEIGEFLSGNVIFSKAGQALCRAINVVKKEGFFHEYCVPIWEQQIARINSANKK